MASGIDRNTEVYLGKESTPKRLHDFVHANSDQPKPADWTQGRLNLHLKIKIFINIELGQGIVRQAVKN